MQLLTLNVQNSVSRSEMGVATSDNTFFRQIGGTIGVTALGALLAYELSSELRQNLPAGGTNLTQGGSNLAQNPSALLASGIRENLPRRPCKP